MLKKLLAHTSVYTAGSLLVTMASLVSFPIFTRIFSVEEYGLLSLISATLMLLVGFGKLGVQHSTVRFYSEVATGKRAVTLGEYYSTVVFGMAASATIVTLLWVGVSQTIPAEWWNDARVRGLLLLTAVLVVLRATDSSLVNILQAQQRSAAYSIYNVIKKYGGLAIILVTVFYVLPGLHGFYVGTIVAEGIAITALFIYLLRGRKLSLSAFSPSLYRAMLVFGIPMIAYEMGGILLNLGDRYIIEFMLGPAALGLYSAAYNFCEYVSLILMVSIGQAIVPMYVHTWEERGEQATRQLVEQSLHFYILLGAAVVAGMAAVGEDMLGFLASEKYREGAVIIPYVAAGMVIDGALAIVAAGLYIHKKTKVLMILVVAAALLNVLLNVLLVPALGIVGAAVATLISYIVLVTGGFIYSRRLLRISIPWPALVKFTLLAIIMYVAVLQVTLANPVAALFGKIIVGISIYSLLVLVFDARARDGLFAAWQRMRGWSGGTK